MLWTTPVVINGEKSIDYGSRILIMGSCFAQSIGVRMLESGFKVMLNPNGISYNPISIAAILRRLVDDCIYDDGDLQEYDGRWFSFLHHGSFDSEDKREVLRNLQGTFLKARRVLSSASHLIVTFGSSWVYKYQGNVVNNCHKMPNKLFDEEQLTVDEIVLCWTDLIEKIYRFNSKIKIIFTISPVRYMGRGAHFSQVNKSTLVLAVDKLCRLYSDIVYFPSYEIVLDELRDYRFYSSDMIHPSDQAVDYVWQRFIENYITVSAQNSMERVYRLKKFLNHVPRNPSSADYLLQKRKVEAELHKILGDEAEV